MLGRAWSRLRQRRIVPGFQSRFGGLWTDRLDALEVLEEKRARGTIAPAEAEALRSWIADGYWIRPGAIAPELVDRLNGEVEELWRRRDERVQVEIDGRYLALGPQLRQEHCKLVDLYAHDRTALEIALAEPIRAFLRTVFEGQALLFQSLSFERGSEQPIHQDTAYVVVTPPMAMVASWIALEDVQPGSGELAYHPGSQRLPEYLFRGYRNWNREHDGLEAQRDYHAWLLAELARRGMAERLFRPRKGDVLFWNADLAHGGSPIRERALTRKSLVCHYCPADARPYYFTYRQERRTRLEHAGELYASKQHDLRP